MVSFCEGRYLRLMLTAKNNKVCKIVVISSNLLLFFIPYAAAASINFNFTKFGLENRYTNGKGYIGFEGAADISKDGIHVTPNHFTYDTHAMGRVTYVEQFHLWDKDSGKLAGFTTDFSFMIDSNNPVYGDGLTFFLAKKDSQMEGGGALGLPVHSEPQKNSFVAVEFDTFGYNKWDPRDPSGLRLDEDHVGIDINSLKSNTSQKWYSNIIGGVVCHAWITYDSVSKNLSVSFTGFQNNTVVMQQLHYIIDLTLVLPEWVIFGFSAATGDRFQNNTVKSWAFNSSDLHIDEFNVPPPTSSPDEVKEPASSADSVQPLAPRRSLDRGKDKNRTGLLVKVTVGLFVVVITFVAVLAFCLLKKRKKKNSREEEQGLDVEMNNEFEMGTGPRKFSYRELARSTSDFAEGEKLGEGGFGGVYKGFLKDMKMHIAVKRVSKSSKQGIKEYASEVLIISKLGHRNLVQLIGWCHEKGELLLVYEFMENGSLDLHLFTGKSLLEWGTRYKIAHGLASALLYLHEEWEQCVLHRDIKSSNVMLDSNFNAKLGDFGLAKMVDHKKGSHTTKLVGTLGYMAHEYIVTGRASKESDVFSFGVVALEITCGRKPIVDTAEVNQILLVDWVWENYGTGTLLEVVDPRLGSTYEEEEIKRLMIIGLWCVHPDSVHRPSMRQVIQVLNSESSLPILPSKMPVASYLSPPVTSLHGVASSIQNQSLSSNFYMGRS